MRVRVHYDDSGLADEWESEGIVMPEAERRRLDRDAEEAREWWWENRPIRYRAPKRYKSRVA